MAERSVHHLIGIAGGSGSGKTTVADKLIEAIGKEQVEIIPFDAYYRDQSAKSETERKLTNYDHPDSLETSLLVEQLKQLKSGKTINRPVYDFTEHNRAAETVTVEPKKVIIVEGILLFALIELAELFEIKIFVDTPDDIRFIRRLKRDQEERGRSTEEVIDQYLKTVRPMHLSFVEPSKRLADIVIPEGGFNNVAMELISQAIIYKLAE